MEALNAILPIILYVLLAILIVVIIVFVIKLIITLDSANRTIKNVEAKINRFNGVFEAIDTAADALSFASDKFSSFVTKAVMNLINKKEEDKDE